MRASRRRDATSTERLHELKRYEQRVAAFARSFVSRHEVVEEMVHEAYVTAWRRIDDVPDDDEKAVGWLCNAARFHFNNLLRGQGRRRRQADKAASHAVIDLRCRVSEEPVVERLVARDALASLSEEDRQLLSWVASEVSYEEIAVRLGISPGAVAMRVLRARGRLDDRLGDS